MPGLNVPSNSPENSLSNNPNNITVRFTAPARAMDTLTKSSQSPISIPESPVETNKNVSTQTLLKQSEEAAKIAVDDRLSDFLHEDGVYQSMLRTVSLEKIRMRLAIRYMIMMFAIFLVFAWVVNSRVIMFGFSEFQLLARLRDGLFAVMAGLFGMTIWFGSQTWFRSLGIILFLRFVALIFFFAVVFALYLPII